MIVVVLHTFKWFSVRIVLAAFLPEPFRSRVDKSGLDRSEVAVIGLVTVVTVIGNLVYAVFAGVLVTSAINAWKIGEKTDVSVRDVLKDKVNDNASTNLNTVKVYEVEGPLFFASATKLVKTL